MTVDYPAHVTGPRRADDMGNSRCLPIIEDPLDRRHRVHQPNLIVLDEGGKHRPDVAARARLERREGLATGVRQMKRALTAIAGGGSRRMRPCVSKPRGIRLR